MHFVTGGAFNGKGKWVNKNYNLEGRSDWYWHTSYKHPIIDFSKLPVSVHEKKLVVISGLEILIREMLEICGEKEVQQEFQRFLKNGLKWERGCQGRTLVLLGSDITKGVVPICAEERAWRDYVGWCYQDIVNQAEQINIVWYGITLGGLSH